jgi:PIN domain nuclease of toxin-antitoxin system
MLSAKSRQLIAHDDTHVLVSASSAWEICTKVRIGKLETARGLSDDFSGYLHRHGFEPLAVTIEHARLAGRLVGAHKDPFDRMLAAQSLIEDVPLVTNDAAFAVFGNKIVW